MKLFSGIPLPLAPFLLVPLCFSCSPPKGGEDRTEAPFATELSGEFPAAGGPPQLILQTGEQALWFELAEDGPRQIYAPGEASLKPFEPWPLARHISALSAQKDRLIMVVNREGFLIAAGGAGKAAGYTGLRRVADPSYWKNYTAGTLFFFGEIPSVLLYRNDFFSGLEGEAPDPPARGLLPGEDRPAALEVTALNTLSAGGWEPDGLRRGPDAYWYFRGIRRDPSRPEIRYFRSAGPESPGEEVSLGAYRNAARPESPRRAPAVLAGVLEEIFTLSGGKNLNIASIISPEFPAPRHFTPEGNAPGEDLTELSGFYRADFPGGTGETFAGALVVLPDGRGVYGRTGTEAAAGPVETAKPVNTGRFSLPPLPEGFVYTGLGCTGNALIAAWEERQEGSIGAAGFMAISLPLP